MDKLKPAHTDSQRGRSAALVHGLAFVAAALALGAVWAVGTKTEEAERILGMGLSAVGVMALWSVVLAMQALLRGEPGAWPMSVLGVVTIEVAALSTFLCLSGLSKPQHFPIRAGLPLFVLFGMFVSFVAVPVAFWRAKRAERSEIAAKKPEWNNKRRWKRRFAWFSGIFTILTVLLLPWPLFLFCAGSAGYDDWPANSQGDWRNSVARHTPDFIRNTVAFLLEQSTLKPVVALHELIVSNGYLSQSELQRHLNGASSVLNQYALYGISRSDPAVALEFAIEIADGRGTCNTPMDHDAGWIMGEYGSAKQIRYCLSPVISAPAGFTETFVDSLVRNKRSEFVPELKRLAEISSPERAAALRALDILVPSPEVEQFWLKLLADQNPKTRREAAGCIHLISTQDVRARMYLECVINSDVQVRYCAFESDAFNAIYINRLQFEEDIKYISYVERLMELLDEHDLIQRRGAVWLLYYIIGARVAKTIPAPWSSVSGTWATCGGTPSPEIPGESETVEAMRVAARKWLAERKR